MFISHELKKRNICEYLLYMWQVEDLIRANDLDLDRLKAAVVDGYDLPDDKRQELLQWYSDLIDMMRLEGVEKEGHLQINRNVILDLTDLHLRLMHEPKFPYYQAAYYKVLPLIVELRAHGNSHGEIEVCMDALYGRWMMQLRKQPIGEETAKALDEIASFMGFLADYHRQDREGTLFNEQETE